MKTYQERLRPRNRRPTYEDTRTGHRPQTEDVKSITRSTLKKAPSLYERTSQLTPEEYLQYMLGLL